MKSLEQHIYSSIACASLSAYASLPKTGKPQAHEHTVLATIALTLPPHAADVIGTEGPVVVAMATGTKCLPGSKRAADGSALNDCHAEVLARRAFVRWAYDEIQATAGSASAGGGEIDTAEASTALEPIARSLVMGLKHIDDGRVVSELLPGVGIHLFVSHPPCGDAAIQSDPTNTKNAQAADGANARTGAKPMKRQKLNIDGPKESTKEESSHTIEGWSVPEAGDVESYASEQATGVVRRKPGRGESTLSVSCSDKVARWTLLGLQGALLGSLLAHPLYLDTIAVAHAGSNATKGATQAATAALHRAFIERPGLVRSRLASHSSFPSSTKPLAISAVPVATVDLQELGFISGGARRVPCGSSIAWRAPPSATWRLKEVKKTYGAILNPSESIELQDSAITKPPLVLLNGFSESLTGLFGCRAGKGRKGSDPVLIEFQSVLCRASLFRRFAEVVAGLGGPAPGTAPWAESYRKAKQEVGSHYAAAWSDLIEPPSPFEGWISKPDVGSVFPLHQP